MNIIAYHRVIKVCLWVSVFKYNSIPSQLPLLLIGQIYLIYSVSYLKEGSSLHNSNYKSFLCSWYLQVPICYHLTTVCSIVFIYKLDSYSTPLRRIYNLKCCLSMNFKSRNISFGQTATNIATTTIQATECQSRVSSILRSSSAEGNWVTLTKKNRYMIHLD